MAPHPVIQAIIDFSAGAAGEFKRQGHAHISSHSHQSKGITLEKLCVDLQVTFTVGVEGLVLAIINYYY